jgi:hypothetical protein
MDDEGGGHTDMTTTVRTRDVEMLINNSEQGHETMLLDKGKQ